MRRIDARVMSARGYSGMKSENGPDKEEMVWMKSINTTVLQGLCEAAPTWNIHGEQSLPLLYYLK